MSSFFKSADVHAVTVESLLTARRMRVLRVVLTDETHPSHATLVAVADMLIDLEEAGPTR